MRISLAIRSTAALLLILPFVAHFGFGQDEPSDTSRIAIPTEMLPKADSAKPLPTTAKPKVSLNFFNLDDSIDVYFLPERFNLADDMTRSFGHDAGDFFKFCPSHLILADQLTPYRKTVSPFALPGNRLNYILDNRALNPLEHIPEPDNQVDLDDIPDASAQKIYNIEGPLGLVFGADNGTSSLVMKSLRQDSTVPVSRMVVDKGANGYANTKGIFAGHSESGQSFRAALEYRKALTDDRYFGDDAYHQWGEIYYPLKHNYRVELTGRLYHRTGNYVVRPDTAIFPFDRFRRDRDLNAGLSWQFHTTDHLNVSFRHQRSEARFGAGAYSTYNRDLDLFDNGGAVAYETRLGNIGIKTDFSISRQELHDAGTVHRRWLGSADIKLLQAGKEGAVLEYFRIEKAAGDKAAPSALIQFMRNSDKSFFSAAIGYSAKIPRLYEKYLTSQKINLLNANTSDYIEFGDSLLHLERQLTANVTAGIGKNGSDLVFSVTGGKIWNGIDWIQGIYQDSSGLILRSFSSDNHDINFLTASGRKKIAIGKSVFISGGASYHYIKVGDDTDPPYSPDFQGFTNLELYHYIFKLDLHLYAYVEMLYAGRYHGPLDKELGEKPEINMKLSFRIKKFRFYYIFQNLPGIEYMNREGYLIQGRLNYYGITWDFLD